MPISVIQRTRAIGFLLSSLDAAASTASRTRNAPWSSPDDASSRFDLGQARSKLFLQMGLDRHISHLPAGQITCRRRKLVQYRRALAGARLPAVFVIPDGLNLPRTADTDLPAGLFARKGSLASEGPAPSAIDLHPQSAGINFIAAKTRSAVASKNRATAA
jgi:hypothetical protein